MGGEKRGKCVVRFLVGGGGWGTEKHLRFAQWGKRIKMEWMQNLIALPTQNP